MDIRKLFRRKTTSTATQVSVLKISWEDYNKLILELYDKVATHAWNSVLAIGNGGIIPAIDLLNRLKTNKKGCFFGVLPAKRYNGYRASKEVKLGVFRGILKEPVLVVDDISDQGETLKAVDKWLRGRRIKVRRYATLFYKRHTRFMPDYTVKENDKWVRFPWE